MNTLLFLALVVATLLSGCGTMSNRASVVLVPSTALTAEQTGVILLSTGAVQSCTSTATFLDVFDAASKKLVEGRSAVSVDGSFHKSDYPDHHGTLNALVLPAGNYYVSPRIANPYVRAIRTPAFGFSVRSGETTYIGELYMTRSCVSETTFVIRDEYNRDQKLAIEKNPSFAQRTSEKRLMQSIRR